MLETVGGVLDIFVGPTAEGIAFGGSERADDFGGAAEDHAAGWDDGALGDEGVRADDGLSADNCAIENGGTHADEALVLDGAGVDNGGMPNRHITPKDAGEMIRKVQNGVILNVGVFADNNAIDIAPQNGVIPNTRVRAERNITENNGRAGDVNVWAEGGLFAEENV